MVATKSVGRAVGRGVVGLLVATALISASCGSSAPKGVASKDIKILPADTVPGPFLGLTVKQEDIHENVAQQGENTYIAALGLYSLHRADDRLEATLQVSKFTKRARPNDPKFQAQIANQLGGSKAQSFRMGGRSVFRASASKQSVSSWFRGQYYFVLSVRETYATPRTLLRTMLSEVNPAS